MGDEAATPFENASAGFNAGAQTLTGLGAGGFDQFYDRFENPYTSDVIDRTTDSMVRNNDLLLNQNAHAADQGGAFGGARHGVVDAVTNAETVRNIGDMEAGLRNTGFNTAMDLGQRHYENLRGLAGDAMDYGAQQYGIGNDLIDRQAAQGDKAQGITQGVLDAAKGIFDSNDPAVISSMIQGLLSGSPLTGNSTTTGTVTPSGAEKFGAIMGGIGDVMGAGK